VIINLHRFASSGFITGFSGAKEKIGFDKNPLSFLFTEKIKHTTANGLHEVERNQELIRHLTNNIAAKPKLYPSDADRQKIKSVLSEHSISQFICIAPASVWFTKQFPKEKWIELIEKLPDTLDTLLLGASSDKALCDKINSRVKNNRSGKTINLAGELSFLESAAMMQQAEMNYVNDSAPMHLASAMNAPVTAIYCSTIPGFGFGPLSGRSKIIETKIAMSCRPCGLHGFNACPLGHFNCAFTIDVNDILQ
jgi:heptosyltransferase-2